MPATPAGWGKVLMAACQPGQSHASLPEVQAAVRLQRGAWYTLLSTAKHCRWWKGSAQVPPGKCMIFQSFIASHHPSSCWWYSFYWKVILAWCTCPRAHATPIDPCLIPRNWMYSLNTGWQRGAELCWPWGSSGEGEWGSSRAPGLQEGPRVTWKGLQPCPSLRLLFQSRKVKGKDDNRTALLCPWLCPPESPGNRESNFPAFQWVGVFFLENYSHGGGKARATGSWFFGFVGEADLELSFPRIWNHFCKHRLTLFVRLVKHRLSFLLQKMREKIERKKSFMEESLWCPQMGSNYYVTAELQEKWGHCR